MPTDFFGRVMVVFQRYGMSMLQGAGVSLRIALVGTIVGCIMPAKPYSIKAGFRI